MTRFDLPRSGTPNEEETAATGKSEAEAARPVRFDAKPEAGPDKAKRDDDGPSYSGELADKKQIARSAPKAAPGAIPPDELTTETDDGAA